MLETFLKILRKIIPKPLFLTFQPAYHLFLALTGNIISGFPGYKMTVIGVTGTNGKSTTCDILTEVLKKSGHKVGMISTVFIEIAGVRIDNKTNRTTLGRWQTHKLMHAMVRRGCKYAVIEAASEGIAWYRILGIPFDAAVFTNLSPEHLNFHGNMENYRNTKGSLFEKLSSPFNFKRTKRVSAVNADDKEAEYFLSFKADQKITFGLKMGDVRATNIQLKADGAEYIIHHKGKDYPVRTKAIGEFNILNELAAFSVGLGYGICPEEMAAVFEKFEGTKGRVEKIDQGQNFEVVVDYAHTPDAQKAVYGELNRFKKGQLIAVFGATGDRDRKKRPEMGRIGAEMADIVILTDDETYTEDSTQILQEIHKGVPKNLERKVSIVPDRFTAIKKALALAGKNDIVVITGIGHQKYRFQDGKKVIWDERQIVSDLLKNMKPSKKE